MKKPRSSKRIEALAVVGLTALSAAQLNLSPGNPTAQPIRRAQEEDPEAIKAEHPARGRPVTEVHSAQPLPAGHSGKCMDMLSIQPARRAAAAPFVTMVNGGTWMPTS